jgi:ketosteroid isomerase-like protein
VSETDNKKVALSFFENLSAGTLDAAPELITDDLVWWLAGEPEQFALAGGKNKTQFTEMLTAILDATLRYTHLGFRVTGLLDRDEAPGIDETIERIKDGSLIAWERYVR